MKVLITGAGGQLGRELQGSAPEQIELVALGHTELDVGSAKAVTEVVGSVSPELIINTAAYTAVDKAEEDQDEASRVNAQGALNVAAAADLVKARLIHLSTDYVFDGLAGKPYSPDDQPRPVSVYGASKRAGEDAVLEASGGSAVVLRTAWLYSRHGNNFVKSVLQLLGEKEELEIVADEVGTPTWAKGLAEAIWQMAALGSLRGIHHWTDAGVASRYDFAVAIRDEARQQGLVETKTPIWPIRSTDYPRPARRPSYGVLDKTATWRALGTKPRHWRESLKAMLRELRDDG